jgi:hypothetical protein
MSIYLYSRLDRSQTQGLGKMMNLTTKDQDIRKTNLGEDFRMTDPLTEDDIKMIHLLEVEAMPQHLVGWKPGINRVWGRQNNPGQDLHP